jgi:hydrogenase/urease accessory protein HupE
VIRVLLGLLLALALPALAHAHAINFAVVFLRVDGSNVQVMLTITSSDVDRAAGVNVTDHGSGQVDPRKLEAVEARLRAYFSQRTRITAGNEPCSETAPAAISAESDGGIIVQMSYACPHSQEIVYHSRAMLDFDRAARQSAQLMRGAAANEIAILDATRNSVALTEPAPVVAMAPPPTPSVPASATPEPRPTVIDAVLVAPPSRLAIAWRYLELGVEHIFLGFDHIAFLAAVLLWARRLGALVKIVTAFTIAHSVTLSLAALGIVHVPSSIVEPAIAASIVVVAVENFFSSDVERRWKWTGALGLIHGFGFASVLTEAGLPQGSLVPALAAFNFGVELGQLVIVAALLSALLLIDRLLARGRSPARPPRLVYGASSAVACLGLWWLVERVAL